MIHQFGTDRAFFCDSVGFPEIKGFFEQKAIEEPEAPTIIEVPAEDVVEVISSPDGIPIEEPSVEAEDVAEVENFIITDNDIGVGTPSQRYQNNVNAIRTLHELQAENRLPTSAELPQNRKYSRNTLVGAVCQRTSDPAATIIRSCANCFLRRNTALPVIRLSQPFTHRLLL